MLYLCKNFYFMEDIKSELNKIINKTNTIVFLDPEQTVGTAFEGNTSYEFTKIKCESIMKS